MVSAVIPPYQYSCISRSSRALILSWFGSMKNRASFSSASSALSSLYSFLSLSLAFSMASSSIGTWSPVLAMASGASLLCNSESCFEVFLRVSSSSRWSAPRPAVADGGGLVNVLAYFSRPVWMFCTASFRASIVIIASLCSSSCFLSLLLWIPFLKISMNCA